MDSIDILHQLLSRTNIIIIFLKERTKPIIRLLKKASKFDWDQHCEDNFAQLEEFLASPPIIHKPIPGTPILVYLAISDEAMSAAPVQQTGEGQQPVYFVSRTLH